ncbi:hypothetical protein T492DRAFT_8391 [Pavlovales sp. CCMP2436]|nr:hypothetical protein T492DRAFT_8391 [Pavlovales sp. CCMP2436]
MCGEGSAAQVVATLVGSQRTDAHLHALATAALDRRIGALPGGLGDELVALRAANRQLAELKRRRAREGAAADGGEEAGGCVGCGKTPFTQLDGCWPEWNFFRPHERCFRCTRTWHFDGGRAPNPAVRRRPEELPCFQDCWQPTARGSDADGARCARALPAEAARALARDGRLCSAPCAAAPVGYLQASRAMDALAGADAGAWRQRRRGRRRR